MRNMFSAGAMLAAVTMLAGSANAAVTVGTVLAENGAEASSSDTSNNFTGPTNLLGGGFSLASGNYSLTKLVFWGNLASDAFSGDFSLSFYASADPTHFKDSTDPSIPGPADAALATYAFSASGTDSGYTDGSSTPYPVVKFEWTPASTISISSDGTPLYLSIAGNSGGTDQFYWSSIAGGHSYKRDTGGPDGWFDTTIEKTLTFRATFEEADVTPPAVPEPASWALMVLGFGVTGAALRRRRTTVAFA